MMTEPLHLVVFPSRDALSRACTFESTRALVRAPWTGRPLSVGRSARLRIEIAGEPAARVVLETVRTGPASDGTQWFLAHGSVVSTLRQFIEGKVHVRSVRPAPGRVRESSGLELSATFDRVAPRWACSIQVLVEAGGDTGQARIDDLSDTGLRLVDVKVPLRPGDRVRVHVHGEPGRGLLCWGRIAWAQPESAGVRFLPSGREGQREIEEWVAEVRVAAMSSSMPQGYMTV